MPESSRPSNGPLILMGVSIAGLLIGIGLCLLAGTFFAPPGFAVIGLFFALLILGLFWMFAQGFSRGERPKLPWQTRTGLAKATAILATIFTISLGLCGANFFAVMRYASPFATTRPTAGEIWVGKALGVAAYLEIAGMGGSFLGLMIVAAVATARAIQKRKLSPPDDQGGQ